MADCDDLGSMASPPVEQMAMGVIFHPIEKLTGPLVGLLWKQFQSELPNINSFPSPPATVEQFGGPYEASQPTVFFGFGEPGMRHAFSDTDNVNALQVQRDVLVRQWIRKREEDQYPEYGRFLRKDFEAKWNHFLRFVREYSLGDVRVRQCEMTYADLVPRGQGWESFADVSNVFVPWCGTTAQPLSPPESITVQASFPITEARGRVVMTLNPGRRMWDNAESILMTFSARVVTGSQDPAALMLSLDIARSWACRVFKAVTPENIRARWREGR